MDGQISNLGKPTNVIPHIHELFDRANKNELDAVAQRFFSADAHTPLKDSDAIEIDAISIDMSADEQESTPLSTVLLETSQSCGCIFDFFLAVSNATEKDKEAFLQQTGLDNQGVSSLKDYLKDELLKTRIQRVPQQAATSLPLMEIQLTTQLLKPPESTAPTGDLIGDTEHPGPVIQKLDELIASNKLDQTQTEAVKKIQSSFLENTKLLLFPDEDSARREKYEHYASRLLMLFDKLDEGNLLAAFALGEGSLCELPEVCNTGWHERIESKMPYMTQSDTVTSFALSSVTPERRNIFVNEIARHIAQKTNQSVDNVHLVAVIHRLFNETFSLGYLSSEINTNEAQAYVKYIQSVCDPVEIKSIFIEKCTPQRLTEEFKLSLSKLTLDNQNEFIQELTDLYARACREDIGVLIDPMPVLRQLYQAAGEANQIESSDERIQHLESLLTETVKCCGITPFKLQPKKLSTLTAKCTQQWPRKMLRFRLPQSETAASALKTHLQQAELWDQLDEPDQVTLNRLSDASAFTSEHRADVAQDLSRLNSVLIEQNVTKFRELCQRRDPESGLVTGFSDCGVVTCLSSAGVLIPAEGLESELSNLLEALSTTAKTTAYENREKSDDRNRILELLHQNVGILHWASDALREDEDFILKAAKIHPKALTFGLCITPELMRKVVENCTTNDLFNIFFYLPDTLKESPTVINVFLEKCPSRQIPELYSVLPDTAKEQEVIIDTCLEKCDHSYISELYSVLPDTLKENRPFIEAFLEKSPPRQIPVLYSALPEDQQKEPTVILKCLDKCHVWEIPDLYQALHETQQKEPTVILKCLDKCHGWDIPELYQALHETQQKAPAVILKCLDKCHHELIPDLYEALPKDQKTVPAVILKCLDKCSDRFIPDLYKALHETQQKEPTVILKCLDKCHHELIPDLYEALPKDQKTVPAVIQKCLDKCSDRFIPDL